MPQRNWPLAAHLLLMFALSIVIAYTVTVATQLVPDETLAYKSGYVFGRGVGSVLFPLMLVAIPAGIYRLIKKERLPAYRPALWIAWGLVVVLSTYGSFAIG